MMTKEACAKAKGEKRLIYFQGDNKKMEVGRIQWLQDDQTAIIQGVSFAGVTGISRLDLFETAEEYFRRKTI